MKTSFLSGNALSISVAAMMLGGCGGPQGVIGQPGTAYIATPKESGRISMETARMARGGGFTAAYAGNYSGNYCTRNHPGTFSFSGVGAGNFIHESVDAGSVEGKYAGRQECQWMGTAKITSMRDSNDSIEIALDGNADYQGCSNQLTFTVTGGTGKFSRASGDGTWTFKCEGNGQFRDHWSGHVTF